MAVPAVCGPGKMTGGGAPGPTVLVPGGPPGISGLHIHVNHTSG